MMINLNKQTIIILLLILWSVFSASYIVFDIWQDFQIRQIGVALERGRVETINQIIQQAEQMRCQPIRLFSEERVIYLIEVGCSAPEPAQP